jgi:cytochrome P450
MGDATPTKKVPAAGLPSYLPPLLLYHLRYRPLELLRRASETQEITRLGWAGSPLYYVSDPQLTADMLMDPRRFIKGSLLKKLEIIIGNGLITLNGDAWKDARRRVQKVFHRSVLARQHEVIIRHTNAIIERLRGDGERRVNLDRTMNELTFNIALELFLGADPDMVDDMDGLQEAIDTLNAYAKWRTWSFIPPHWKTRRNEQFRQALGLLDGVVEKVLRARRGESEAERGRHADVLSLLLEAGFEGKALRDQVMTMMIAGHETTGTTLSFLWAHAARRPDVQDALFYESQSLGDELDLTRLPYAEAVWREILRLYPAVPILDRLAVEDVNLRGYRIPAGANVLWSPFVLHRSPKYWPHRADPDVFDPDAFLRDPPPLPGTFIPFGEGPRKCLGQALADMEALTIISLLVRAFRMESAQEGGVAMRTLVTLRPAGGVVVDLFPRQKAESGESRAESQAALAR